MWQCSDWILKICPQGFHLDHHQAELLLNVCLQYLVHDVHKPKAELLHVQRKEMTHNTTFEVSLRDGLQSVSLQQ